MPSLSITLFTIIDLKGKPITKTTFLSVNHKISICFSIVVTRGKKFSKLKMLYIKINKYSKRISSYNFYMK